MEMRGITSTRVVVTIGFTKVRNTIMNMISRNDVAVLLVNVYADLPVFTRVAGTS